jgi:hypothetical protein
MQCKRAALQLRTVRCDMVCDFGATPCKRPNVPYVGSPASPCSV